MKSLKKITCTTCALLLTFSLVAQEKSAEESYLSTVEDVVITELANSDERDNKLVALQYLENAVEEGRVSPDMLVALDHLAGEGINTQSRQGGRLMNNYPDIRAKACDLLGKVPSEESKTTLKNIALADNEPMVITAAVRSLGDIGMNDNDDVVNTIAWANKKNAVLNPTSSLALEVLIAYEKIADKVQDKSAMIQSVGQIATNYKYVKPVRDRALALLKQLQSNGSNSGKKNANKDAK
ncbi:MAG: HEAT repeat domain-containing protein [Treponema sp.]|uniref:HEAT repeat domain-containing protein n=1 Tax=Treponema sp. TaxID=166 RepID=UPI0025D4D4AB|nr:HEAT repeat domain-containing protein [Treponema sp.]MBQ9281079.1 HEAT repeat domain-containing protein [Treponema sp.]